VRETLKCKGCSRANHPHYNRKYHGYCLDCANAGVPDLRDRIEELEAEVASLRANQAGCVDVSGFGVRPVEGGK
jgi:hypothetical protein